MDTAVSREHGPPLIWHETKENLDALERATDAARQAEITANDPLRLLAFAQSAVARGIGGEFNADLHFAFSELRSAVSAPRTGSGWKSSHTDTSLRLRALMSESQSKAFWKTFDLCCTVLSHDRVLADPVSASSRRRRIHVSAQLDSARR